MAKLNIWNWVRGLGRWLEGGRSARRQDVKLRVDFQPPRQEAPPLDSQLSQQSVPGKASVIGQAGTRSDRTKVARTFDSAHPVRTRSELFGRSRELDELLSATLYSGQHVIIHGARGSGKTSLVRVFGDHADGEGAIVIYLACEPGGSFADLIRPYLRALPPAALVSGTRARFQEDLAALPQNFGARAFVDLVAERIVGPVVFIFDEFDRITDDDVKAEISVAMKLLSDALVGILFTLVGIANSVANVIECHPSLRRHMRAVSLGRIEPSSVKELIDAGEVSTGLTFEEDARAAITRASCGSPFHVRLFCQHAAIAAIARASSNVVGSDARSGLHSAILQWAAMNVDDARRFMSLVESKSMFSEIERIAYAAALGDRLPANIENARTLLGDTLIPEDSGGQSLVFRDSVAPQFLIAYVILAEAATAPQPLDRLGAPIDATTL